MNPMSWEGSVNPRVLFHHYKSVFCDFVVVAAMIVSFSAIELKY